MRIDATTIGLAAYLAGVTVVTASSGLQTEAYINFSTEGWGTDKIFQNGSMISWTVQDENITVSKAYLVKYDANHTAVAKAEQGMSTGMKRFSFGEKEIVGTGKASYSAIRDSGIDSTSTLPFDLNGMLRSWLYVPMTRGD